jgi:hypothetical protein
MKIRLLALTSPIFSPLDVLLTEMPSYIQTEGSISGFTNSDDTISFSCGEKASFVKTDTVLPFSSDLKYSTEAITDDELSIHCVSSLNV